MIVYVLFFDGVVSFWGGRKERVFFYIDYRYVCIQRLCFFFVQVRNLRLLILVIFWGMSLQRKYIVLIVSYCLGLLKLVVFESCVEGLILILIVIYVFFSWKFDSCGFMIRVFQGLGYIVFVCFLRVVYDRGLGGIIKENENFYFEYREKKERKGINLLLILFYGLFSLLILIVVFFYC